MGDENSVETMNLDLNLDPDGSSPESDPTPDSLLLSNFANNNNEEEEINNNNDSVNLEDWIEGQQNGGPVNNIVRESSSSSYRPHRMRRWRSLLGSPNLNPPFLHPGEGSVSNNNVVLLAKECCSKNEGVRIEQDESKTLRKEEGGGGEEGGNEEEDGSFFECNICLDVSSDPVLTCCGHLFCWPCLYQWLNVHSDSKECPVCKGEVTVKNLTPIYGRGGGGGSSITNDQKPCLKIPDRPQAKRVESWRQTIQRNAFAFPMDEMIRRLGSGADFPRDSIENHPLSIEGLNESHERNSSLLNRILTSRGMRQEQAVVPPQEDADDSDFTNARSHTYRSLHAYRAVPNGEIVNIARRLMEYTSGEQDLLPVDDRDSVSSIAAVIQSESQTLDTAMEIDSTVSLSTSSSRRRVDASSMVSDVDSGDSRAPRRRRLN